MQMLKQTLSLKTKSKLVLHCFTLLDEIKRACIIFLIQALFIWVPDGVRYSFKQR